MNDENTKTTGRDDGAEWLSVPAKPTAFEIPAHVIPRPAPTAPPRDESPIYRRFSPRRNRWADVDRFDERAREIEQRARSLNEELERLQERLREANERDREALVDWQSRDGQGARPEPTAPAITREIEERTADREAAIQAAERVYEEKAAYVEKHRKRLMREADKATRGAYGRCMDALDAFERAREELVESREAGLWAAFYPSELAQVFPAWAHLATGLRKPVEQALGVKTVIPAASVVAALRADADVLSDVATEYQAAAMRGVSVARLTGREAQWREGKTDFVGPRFEATWSGSPEEAVEAERARKYSEAVRKRLWGG